MILENLYPASPKALEFLYSLLQDRPPGSNISHKTLPSYKAHCEFVNNVPYRYWYLIKEEEMDLDWVGYIYATHRNEIGIMLKKECRGAGLGQEALKGFLENHDPAPAIPSERNGNWVANVAVGNTRSHKLFGKFGQMISMTYEL